MDYMETFNDPNRIPVNVSSSFNYTATRQDKEVTFRCEAVMDLRPKGPQLHISSQDYVITVNCKYIICRFLFFLVFFDQKYIIYIIFFELLFLIC